MTRRRFYAPPENFAADQSAVTLDDEESRHLREVLRLQPGDQVYVFDGEGREFLCEIQSAARRGAATLAVKHTVAAARPESEIEITLALALLKGEKFDLVVQKATELGVARIVPTITRRADVRLRDERDAAKRETRWRRLALEAAKQSGRARVPQIVSPRPFAELIVDADSAGRRVFFSERGGGNLRRWAASGEDTRRLALLVGPEGGWDDDEIARGRDAGWDIITLGGRTLRAETAAIVAVALLQHICGDLF